MIIKAVHLLSLAILMVVGLETFDAHVLRAAEAPSNSLTSNPGNSASDDPYLWLEDVTGERSLSWVREQNALSKQDLETSPVFEQIRKRLLTILDSKERIPYVAK